MRTPVYTRQFEKDVKRMKRRGKKLEKLKGDSFGFVSQVILA